MQTFFKAFGVLWLYNQKNLLKKTFIREKTTQNDSIVPQD